MINRSMFAVVSIFFGAVSLATAQSYTTVVSVFSSGGSTHSVGTYSLTNTIGQSLVGQSIVGPYSNGSGFWFQVGGELGVSNTGIFSVTAIIDTGEGSLRAALDSANARPGLNIITFNIAGSGVHTITPSAPLPEITEAVIIDGYTQPGASPNTNGPGLGSNAVLLIELNGVNSGGGSPNGCLIFRGGGNTIKGLVINRAPSAGMVLYLGGNNVVQGNFIGTDPTGTIARPNNIGVLIEYHNGGRIGGTTPAARNVISGNTGTGISLGSVFGVGGSGHMIEGNLIGTNAAGTAALGNSTGIHLGYEVTNTLIGGMNPNARNVISGNTAHGVTMSSGLGSPNVSNNVVQGNFIGTDVTGTVALGNAQDGVGIYGLNNTVGGTTPGARNIISGNGRHGVHIFSGDGSAVQGNYIGTDTSGALALGNRSTAVDVTAHRVKIGGMGSGEGNIIAFNGTNPAIHAGVAVAGNARRNSILGNSIFSNVGLGVDLGGGAGANGVTPNDPCDADTLVPNDYQNYPVLTSVQSSGGNTVIGGTLDSKPNQSYHIEFFSSPERDSTEYGEGKTFLGATDVATNASCSASFNVTLPVSVPIGNYVSATATDTAGNTSEFSRSIAAGTTGVDQQTGEVPGEFVLDQNYPNPFNPTTTIAFTLPSIDAANAKGRGREGSGFVSLKVYDLLGQEVATLVNEVRGPGVYSVTFDGSHLSSGMYLFRLTAGSFVDTKKLVLLK